MFDAKFYMRKTGFLLVLLTLVMGGMILGSTAVQKFSHSKDVQVIVSFPPKNTPEAQDMIELPSRISIPAIGVDASVEQVGQDSQGRMDVPQNADNVAWYQMGFKPGENGNAVFAGHLDKATGEPAVFWNIPTLKRGDKIVVSGNSGKSLTYVITRTEQYPYNDFPLEEVFGPSERPMLNLITCVGSWNSAEASYSHRFVVYSQIVGN